MDQVALNTRRTVEGGYRANPLENYRDQDVENITSKVVKLISEPGLVVTIKKAEENTQPVSFGSIIEEPPEIEAPKNAGKNGTVQYRNASVLEKLLMYLQLENDELRSRQVQERLDTEKVALKLRHDDMRNKIDENIKAMKEAAHQALLQKILGWVMVGIMVIAAVVTAGVALFLAPAAVGATAGAAAATGTATAATTGTATAATTAATAGAAGAAATAASVTAAATAATAMLSSSGIAKLVVLCLTALFALTNQILNETGTMKKLQEQIAETIRRNHHISEEKANMIAQILIASVTAVVMVAGGIYGGGATANALKLVMALKHITDAAQTALQLSMLSASIGMGAGTLAQQGVSINAQYKQGKADAEVSEVRALLQLVQQMIDETQEELQQILEKIQDELGKMFDVISSALDAEKEIASNTGGMA